MACPKCKCKVTYQYNDDVDDIDEAERCSACGYIFDSELAEDEECESN